MEKKNVYPYLEGDDYWVIENGKVIWSCWDDVSEELHDTNPDREYFDTKGCAEDKLREDAIVNRRTQITMNGIIVRGDINELKDLVLDIQETIKEGNELPSYITDFFYSIESSYQAFYSLDQDNWDKNH